MHKFIAAFLWLLSVPTLANDNVGCAKVGASMYIGLTDAIVNDLKINPDQIIRDNVAVEVLSILPISKFYADQLAEKEFKHQTTNFLRKDDYARIFYEDDVKIIVAKYTYRNANNQKNVFIASSLKNKYECSIRFNGYLIVKREF